jgi:hypothetical protein
MPGIGRAFSLHIGNRSMDLVFHKIRRMSDVEGIQLVACGAECLVNCEEVTCAIFNIDL